MILPDEPEEPGNLMDIDFSALAARIGSDVDGIKGCIVVSRDGLVLGSHPPDGEAILRPAWLRFAALGEVSRGFIEFPGEIWVYLQRGSFAAFAICTDAARPGLILDEIEQNLLTAEESRVRSPATPVGGGEAPRSKPRAPLHPEPRQAPPATAPAFAEPAQPAAEASPSSQAAPISAAAPDTTSPPAQTTPAFTPIQSADSGFSAPAPAAAAESDVDRVLLAQEFAQLLGESGYDDEDDQ